MTFCSPNGTVFQGLPLGAWISEQIEQVRNNTLDVSKVRKLEGIGFAGTIQKIQVQMLVERNEERKRLERQSQKSFMDDTGDDWLRNYTLLEAFRQEFGTGQYFAHLSKKPEQFY